MRQTAATVRDRGATGVALGEQAVPPSPVFCDIVAEAARFPPARRPMLPLLGSALQWPRRGTELVSVFDDEATVWTYNGRSALAAALSAAGLRAGDTVLLPAYHCGSIVEPAMWLGCDVSLYRMQTDLQADLDDIRARLGRGGVRALVAVHFFGFPQQLDELVTMCAEHDVALIEDCSHAFLGWWQGRPLGSMGDYAFASTVKFFPGGDGGGLVARDAARLETLRRRLRQPSWRDEARVLWGCIDAAAGFGRLDGFGRALTTVQAWRHRRHRVEPRATMPAQKGPYRWFEPEKVERAMSRVSRLSMLATDRAAALAARRANFKRLADRLGKCSGMSLLHAGAPDSVVPYVVPLLLDRPDVQFAALKLAGVPLWRWEELALGDCEVSRDYRLRLVQLPCHQSLREEEVEALGAEVIAALGA